MVYDRNIYKFNNNNNNVFNWLNDIIIILYIFFGSYFLETNFIFNQTFYLKTN